MTKKIRGIYIYPLVERPIKGWLTRKDYVQTLRQLEAQTCRWEGIKVVYTLEEWKNYIEAFVRADDYYIAKKL